MKRWEKWRRRYINFILLIRIVALGLVGSVQDYYVDEEENPKLLGNIPVSNISKVLFNHVETSSFISVIVKEGVARIETVKRIDRDTLKRDSYHVVLLGSFEPIEINIFILDINDNAPTFPRNQSISISESADIGDNLQLEAAVDIDSGNNGVIHEYEIIDGNLNNVFELRYFQPSNLLYLVLNKKIDREEMSNYSLLITAYDSGHPFKTGSCRINITVIDVNDNPPMFTNALFEIYVFENMTVGNNIFHFQASDKDEGANSELSYFLSGNDSHGFTIDKKGWLKLYHPVDYEICTIYNFYVFVVDAGQPPLNTSSVVIAHILDVNDNKPSIYTLERLPIYVRENNKENEILTVVCVSDIDSAEVNGNISLRLLSNKDKFEVVAKDSSPRNYHQKLLLTAESKYLSINEYFLRTLMVFDREMKAFYNLTIQASDQMHSRQISITIMISDENDNHPVFTSAKYAASLDILTPIGSYVNFFHAIDKDEGDNGRVTYAIIPSKYSRLFAISNAGVLLTTISLNEHIFEDNFTLTISASDHGQHSLKSFVNAHILITGRVNRCVPAFKSHSSKIIIDSQVKPGSILANYEATCGNMTQRLLYYLDGKSNIYFRIDSKGFLYLKQKVEEEKWSLKIIAVNADNPLLSSFINIRLLLNNTMQQFPYYEKSIYFIDLSTNHDSTSSLVKLTNRYKINYPITHNITSGNENGMFSLNKSSGELQYVGRKRPPCGCYKLTIDALERGHIVDSTEVAIFTSRCLHGSPALFLREFYSFDMPEHSPISSIVGFVSMDKGYDGFTSEYALKYYIESAEDMRYFNFNSDGYIVLVGNIDRELKSVYDFVIVAMQNCTIWKARVRVNVIDINDHIPVFLSESVIVIPDTTEIFDLVYSAVALDPDLGSNGLLTYELLDDAIGNFHISETTGHVFLLKELFEPIYKIEISVHDNGTPLLESRISLRIAVNETTNNPPYFPSFDYALYLKNDHELFSPCHEVIAKDCDFGLNGVLSYSFLTYSDLFGIYPNGMIYLRRNHSKEEMFRSWKLEIRVQDKGKPNLEARLAIFIYIGTAFQSDVFINGTYHFDIHDNMEINEIVGNISLLNHNTSLTLTPDNGHFVLIGPELRIKTKISRDKLIKSYGSDTLVLHVYGLWRNSSGLARIILKSISSQNTVPQFLSRKINTVIEDNMCDITKYVVASPTNQSRFAIFGGNKDGAFSINEVDGILHLDKSINKCKTQFKLTILVFDILRTDSNDTLELILHTKNMDCLCYMFDNTVTVEIEENAKLGTMVYKIPVAKTKLSRLITYRVDTGNEDFNFLLHPYEGTVQIIKRLDFETKAEFKLKVVASTGNHTGETYILIRVLDCNDNEPLLKTYGDTWFVDNNVLKGTIIGNCSATDIDSNSSIIYSIDLDVLLRNFIDFDKNYCVLRLKKSLIESKLSRFKVNISAYDGKYTSWKEVSVIIRNTKKPAIISSMAVTVASDIQPNMVHCLYNVTVEKFNFETYKFSLPDSAYSDIFTINSTSGQLYLTYTWPSHIWYIYLPIKVASSNGRHRLFSLLLFKTHNDDLLHFQSSVYYTAMAENKPIGMYLIELHAQYKKQPPDSDLRYYITGADNRKFHLDNITGKMFVNDKIDYEKVGKKIILNVYVLDIRSKVPRTNFAQVQIDIWDINDNYPIFLNQAFILELSENTDIFSNIANITAYDIDSGCNSEIRYYIDYKNSSEAFAIDHLTGMVRLIHSLDREMISHHFITVTATDRGEPVRATSKVFTVIIMDVNDNPPIFNQSRYFFSVPEGINLGVKVGAVLASDKDDGRNSELYYFILLGNYGHFSIEIASGVIYQTAAIDYDEDRLFVVNILVKDGGNPSLNETVDVIIDVKANPCLKKTLSRKYYYLGVAESIKINIEVLHLPQKVKTIDSSDIVNRHQIISGNIDNKFSILSNGSLIVNSELDREVHQKYILYILEFNQNSLTFCNNQQLLIVNVTILDVNDNMPFLKTSPIFFIKENVAEGSYIGRVNAFDSDDGTNGCLIFKILSDNIFSVNLDGRIKLLDSIDYESQSNYQFDISICDKGNPTQCHTNETILVFVEDVNDNAPIVIEHQENIAIFYNISSDYSIVQIEAYDRDSGKNGQISYSLESCLRIFRINQDTGIITVRNNSLLKVGLSYTVTIKVFDHGSPQRSNSTNVTLNVIDNNRAPEFEQNSYSVVLVENQNYSYPIAHVKATYFYGFSNSSITYSIYSCQPSNNKFIMNTKNGEISLIGSVDRELTAFYNISVQAFNSKNPSLIAITTVYVTIEDVNDNIPIISFPSEVFIYENVSLDLHVLTIKATDNDVGENGSVVFALLNHDFVLKINHNKGVVTTKHPLDFELQSSYQVTFSVSDCGTPSNVVVANFTLRIVDINDCPPKFLKHNTTAYVPAGLLNDNLILQVNAFDKDSPQNELRYWISDIQFHVNNFGDVLNKKILNQSQYHVNVKVFDTSYPNYEDNMLLAIYALESDYPMKLIRTYFVEIEEENLMLKFQSFLEVSISNRNDANSNIKHSYYIIGKSNQFFLIDANNGSMYLRTALDYEKQARHIIWIAIYDLHQNRLHFYSKVIVFVQNINDQPPKFASHYDRVEVSENQTAGSFVMTVKAVDADGQNENISYAIKPISFFSINQTTGTILTTVALDYEAVKEYTIRVTAFDPSNSNLNDSITICIIVQNINDNPPVTKEFIKIFLKEDFPPNKTFFNIEARDPDGIDQLYFSVASDTFAVHRESGELYLKKSLDREEENATYCRVIVSDSKYSATTLVNLVITDVNDSPPIFMNIPLAIYMFENMTVGDTIYTLEVYDNDVGINAESNIFMESEENVSDYIGVTVNGKLYLRREVHIGIGMPIAFSFNVTAVNVAYPFFIVSTEITIKVIDVNDHPPIFDQEIYDANVLFTSSMDTFVTAVNAMDLLDTGDNAIVSYDILNGNGTALFKIKDNIIYTKRQLNKADFFSWWYLIVRASDHGFPSLSSTCIVKIFIEEPNLNAPMILDLPYRVSVKENSYVGVKVLQINATDVESRKRLNYRIVSGNDRSIWGINDAGSLFLWKYLDYETQAFFNLIILVTDNNRIHNMSTETNIFIEVIDVNDNKPIFSKDLYIVTIKEDFDISQIIIKVKASDEDSLNNGNISYYLQNKDARFVIHPFTGEIKSLIQFDYETIKIFRTIVIAIDNGTPAFSSSSTVVIYLKDVNEFAPVFDSVTYKFAVPNHLSVGYSIGFVKALDQDAGPEGKIIYTSAAPRHIGFDVNPITGYISITAFLIDGYRTFQVIASNHMPFKNGLYTNTTVRIHVFDANIPPIFSKDIYRSAVFENVTIGEIITEVTLLDHNNGSYPIRYALSDTSSFTVEPISGRVRTISYLDRERVDAYNLTVYGTVEKRKPLTAESHILIEVMDINDNAPIIQHCIGNIMENSEIGTPALTLTATDADDDPNGPPFTYELDRSIENFYLDGLILRSCCIFDREEKSIYKINVTVYDNGDPQLSSTAECVVRIMDIDDNPGHPRNVKVFITHSNFSPTSRYIGDISPVDIDIDDRYSCRFDWGYEDVYFSSRTCNLFHHGYFNPIKDKIIFYSGTKGKDSYSCSASVRYIYFPTSALYDGLIIHTEGLSIYQFLNDNLMQLQLFLNKVILTQIGLQANSHLASIQEYADGVNMIFVLNSDLKRRKDILYQAFQFNILEIQKIFNASNLIIDFNPCTIDKCLYPLLCNYYIHFDGTDIINTNNIIFHSHHHRLVTYCQCPPGFVEDYCDDRPTSCSQRPCFNEGACTEIESSFKCECPVNFQGAYCHLDVDECLHNPCQNGGVCVNRFGGFYCTCSANFIGELCEIKVSPCIPNPCHNEGDCQINREHNFLCVCRFGFTGDHCESGTLHFLAGGYLAIDRQFSEEHLKISADFATIERNSFILIAYSDDVALCLSIIESKLTLVFTPSLSQTEFYTTSSNADTSFREGKSVAVGSEINVSDGYFHSFQLLMNSNMISLFVDGRSRSTMHHEIQRTGVINSLNIGSIVSDDIIRKHAGILRSAVFIGCIGNIVINGESFNDLSSVTSHGVTHGCDRQNVCDEHSCDSNGQCVDLWSTYECKCPGGYISKKCNTGQESIKLLGKGSAIQLSMTKSYRQRMLLKESIRSRRHAIEQESFFSTEYRTRNDGVIFNSISKDGQSTSVYLSNGIIRYSFSSDNGAGNTSIGQSSTTDGKWHSITVRVRGRTTLLTLDVNQSVMHTYTIPPHQFFDIDIKSFTIGRGFKGCLGKLRINKDALYLSSSTSQFIIERDNSTQVGCKSSDICAFQPCRNQSLSYCVDTWESFKCVSPGMCRDEMCKNGGRCVPHGVASFSCDCSHTIYAGRFCETAKACLSNPCKHGKFCVGLDSNEFKCVDESVINSHFKTYITVTIIGAATALAFLVALCAARRTWMAKNSPKPKKDVKFKQEFTEGFDNLGQDVDDDNPVNSFNLNYLNYSKSLSSLYGCAPDERVPSPDNHRYRPPDITLETFSHDSDINPTDVYTYSDNNANMHLNSSVNDRAPSLQLELGSTTTEDMSQTHLREIYDIDGVSMGFSERSLPCAARSTPQSANIPSFTIRSCNSLEGNQSSYSADSDSQDSFTGNEYCSDKNDSKYKTMTLQNGDQMERKLPRNKRRIAHSSDVMREFHPQYEVPEGTFEEFV